MWRTKSHLNGLIILALLVFAACTSTTDGPAAASAIPDATGSESVTAPEPTGVTGAVGTPAPDTASHPDSADGLNAAPATPGPTTSGTTTAPDLTSVMGFAETPAPDTTSHPDSAVASTPDKGDRAGDPSDQGQIDPWSFISDRQCGDGPLFNAYPIDLDKVTSHQHKPAGQSRAARPYLTDLTHVLRYRSTCVRLAKARSVTARYSHRTRSMRSPLASLSRSTCRK